MSLATFSPKQWSFFSALDRGLSEEAREVRRARAVAMDDATSITVGSRKRETLEALQAAFSQAQENGWDGYQSSPADINALIYALHFLNQLPSIVSSPEIAIDVDGDVAVEWDFGPRRILSVRVGRDGTLQYSGLVGHATFHGVESLRESIPGNISAGIERVNRSASI